MKVVYSKKNAGNRLNLKKNDRDTLTIVQSQNVRAIFMGQK